MTWRYVSALQGAVWPALPVPAGAGVMALLFQLERTQWLSPDALWALQAKQLDALLDHAFRTVPFYRERWGEPPDAARFEQLPLLSRRDLQENYDALKSRALPREHGAARESRTSGSTGAPVRVLKTVVNGLLWNALTLRDHRWHRRDLDGTLAVIRKGAGFGEQANWGPATDGLVATGKCFGLDVEKSVGEQLEWLAKRSPDYLLTYPSIAGELARLSLERGTRLDGLREVRTLGEALDGETRALVRDTWNAPLTDMYTTEEVGYVALQCPEHEHYHVQSESVLVEVVGEGGVACAPGDTGRVVMTDLHNFATPLIRYDIGDFAEAGPSCPCGRGLPVLRRILGRVRNMLVTGNGERFWPSFGLRRLHEIAPVLQHQFAQTAPDLVEARLVTASPLAPPQEEALRRLLLARLPPGFRVEFAYRDRIDRGPGGKYEDFVSELPIGGAR